MIKLKEVTKVYTTKHGLKTTALKGVDLTFGDCGLVFVLGKSGCGKSTLLNMIGGIDSPTSGTIVIDGVSSVNFTPRDYNAYRNTYVGFIFQDFNLINDYTVYENVAISVELQHKRADMQEIDKILREVELIDDEGRTLGRRMVTELSGGQKQRVAIARALIKEPKIILADEPTGALDSKTGDALYELLKKLSKEKLVIVVTHDRTGALRYGDRIIELKDGKVINDSGTAKEISSQLQPTAKFVCGKLPLKRAFAMGAGGLKKNVFRLLLSIVLCVGAFIAFGFSFTALTIDPYETQFSSMRVNGLQMFCVESRNILYKEEADGYLSAESFPLTEKQIAVMREYGKHPIGLYSGEAISREENGKRIYGIKAFLAEDSAVLEEMAYEQRYYALAFNGLTLLAELSPDSGEKDANLTPDSRFKNPELCHLPQTLNEIAITDWQYNIFAEFGYRSLAGIDSSINSPDDMIGKQLGSYTVCGVYETELDREYFVKNKKDADAGPNEVRQNYYSAINSVLNYGYVCKGAFANTEPVQYLIKYEGDTSSIKAMLKEMTYSEGEKDYGAEIQTFYGVFLPAENFYEDIVKIAFAVSLVLMVFSVLLFMSFLSASIERRKRELGILRALGARKLDVVNICLIESMIVALINFALSLPGVYIVCAVLNVNFLLSVFNVGVLQIMVLLMICFGVAALATILPVYKMMRRQPVDIIRESQP